MTFASILDSLGDVSSLDARFVPFTAQTRMSGVDLNDSRLRSGAGYAVLRWVDRVARQGSTPLAVARDSQVLGVTAAKIAGESGVDDFLADATRRPSSR